MSTTTIIPSNTTAASCASNTSTAANATSTTTVVTDVYFVESMLNFSAQVGSTGPLILAATNILVNDESYAVQVMPVSIPPIVAVVYSADDAAASTTAEEGQLLNDPQTNTTTTTAPIDDDDALDDPYDNPYDPIIMEPGHTTITIPAYQNATFGVLVNTTAMFPGISYLGVTFTTWQFASSEDSSLSPPSTLMMTRDGLVAVDACGGIQQRQNSNVAPTFGIQVSVIPQQQDNYLGHVVVLGLTLMSIVVVICLVIIPWLVRCRATSPIRQMQPVFLTTLAIGVMLVAFAILPGSVDDEYASQATCDAACMAGQWILTMGQTIVFASLFSKLWRINRVFHIPRFRRIEVHNRDVIVPFVVLFTINFAILLAWTLVDPIRWTRTAVSDKEWVTVGYCKTGEQWGALFQSLTNIMVFGTLIVAGYQAYEARTIPDEFSESRNLGWALLSWLQVLLLGVPLAYIIDATDVAARYYISVIINFAMCMSMLLAIYLPMYTIYRQHRKERRRKQPTPTAAGATPVSGLQEATSNNNCHPTKGPYSIVSGLFTSEQLSGENRDVDGANQQEESLSISITKPIHRFSNAEGVPSRMVAVSIANGDGGDPVTTTVDEKGIIESVDGENKD